MDLIAWVIVPLTVSFATIVATFGLDVNGNPTGCPGAGTYYYKIVWTGANGMVRTFILPY